MSFKFLKTNASFIVNFKYFNLFKNTTKSVSLSKFNNISTALVRLNNKSLKLNYETG